MTAYEIPTGPKMLRETLCRVEGLVLRRTWDTQFIQRDAQIIAELIAECDRHRPIGNDGNHDIDTRPRAGAMNCLPLDNLTLNQYCWS